MLAKKSQEKDTILVRVLNLRHIAATLNNSLQATNAFSFVWSGISSPITGVLAKTSHLATESLNNLVSLLMGTIQAARKFKKVAISVDMLDRYGSLGQSIASDIAFQKSPWISSPNHSTEQLPQLLEFLNCTLQQLASLNPKDARFFYSLGDVHFEKVDLFPNSRDSQNALAYQSRYKEAVKFYMIGASIENSFFTSQKRIGGNFYSIIRQLITALHQSKGTKF